ncbi:MAG: BON domain-containing protein [Acidobacteria bacterium]|nr:BON domain-containing protein [Acidobacteriota bacterium]
MAALTNHLSDNDLHSLVLRQLEPLAEIDLHALHITVEEGVVTLAGLVKTQAASIAAERAVKRAYGVRALVNDLEVKAPPERLNTEIARDALRALYDSICVPTDQVLLTVSEGVITLEGKVQWEFQRMIAESSVKFLAGVKGVRNHIQIRVPTEDLPAETVLQSQP